MTGERDEVGWFGGLVFWLGLIAVIVAVCWPMSIASFQTVPQVNDPPDPIKVPELAGDVPPLSDYGEFDLGKYAKEVEFESFLDKHTPSYKVINQNGGKVTAFLVTSEVCVECPGKKQDTYAGRQLKEVDTDRMKIDFHEFSSDGTVTIYVERGANTVGGHIVWAVVITSVIVVVAVVVWIIVYKNGSRLVTIGE